ncbi:hypothetical protein [Streptosporangium sp. NPDC051022]|uniref:hypothetical protein n=1 Tax=Streptosporangium sp. NPDC051022 TaxID=3155752 RepID=UPI0034252B06
MFQHLRRLGLVTAAFAAALTVIVGLAVPASAGYHFGFPGEDTQWRAVTYAGGPISSRSTPGEARDNHGDILHAWRGADNDGIWISLNNGPAYQLPATSGGPGYAQTHAAPVVIWTDDGFRGNFRIFHTGTDGHLYQHRVQLTTSYQLPATLPFATKVPNDARTSDDLSVAAAALPNNSYMLGWNSQTNNDIWTMYYDGGSSAFATPSVVPNATSYKAPALAAQVNDGNAPWNQVVLAFTGTDNNVYMARQRYGFGGWTNPQDVGWSRYAPSVTLSGTGYGAVAYVDLDNGLTTTRILRNGDSSEYYEENAYAWTGSAPLAVTNGSALYYVINGAGSSLSGVLWKFATDFGTLPTPPAPQW